MKSVRLAAIASTTAVIAIVGIPLAATGEFDWPWAQQAIENHEQRLTTLEEHDGVTPSATPAAAPATAPTDSTTGQAVPAPTSSPAATPPASPSPSQSSAPAVQPTPRVTVTGVTQRKEARADGYDYYCTYTYSDGSSHEDYQGWADRHIELYCPSV